MKYLIGLIVLFSWFSVAAAQNAEAEFKSLAGRFAITLPVNFDDYKSPVPLKIGKDDYTVSIYKWKTQVGLFTISYGSTPKYLEQPDQTKDFFRDFHKLLLTRAGDKVQIVEDRSATLADHPGFELITESSSVITAFRILVVHNRFYMLALALQPNQRDLIAAGEQVLSSFRFVTPEETAAMQDRLVESFDALPLPQEPVVSKAKTDAEDENLKGNVKTVFATREIYYGAGLADIRTPVVAKYFNDRGNLTKEVEYTGDVPINVTSYGYLNGARVSRKVFKAGRATSRLYGVEANPLNQTIQLTREIKSQYTDGGLLAETDGYDNDGVLAEKTAFKYTGNRRETDRWRYYTLLNTRMHDHSKTIETLDDKGAAIEATEITYQEVPANYYSTTARDAVSNPTTSARIERKATEDKYAYTNEYDSHGNWIKRDVFRLTGEKPGPRIRVLVLYRKITYW